MIRNPEKLREFEDNYVRDRATDHEGSLKAAGALYDLARRLEAMGYEQAMEALEAKIRVARVLNAPYFREKEK